jgi:cell division protein FtsW
MPFDVFLVAIVVVLVGLGLVMIFSASYVQANAVYGQSAFFFLRQLRWLVLGLAAMFVLAFLDYRYLKRLSVLIMAGTILVLVALLLFGEERLGARLHLANGSIQPSEIAKLTIAIYIAYWVTSKGERLRDLSYGLVPFAILLGLITSLIVLQPDFGTASVVVVTGMVMFFVAGADLKQLLISLMVAGGTLYLAVTRAPHANQRLQEFVAGLSDPLTGSSYQVREILLALARGGLFGVGLGNGSGKVTGGVPLLWSDSIFAVVGEELGLLGALMIVALFVALAYRGLSISLKSQDQFGLVLGCGITAWLAFQAFLNMAVSTAMLPFTGLTLPFVSYGGSSLLASLAGIGVLLSISRYGTKEPATARLSGDRKAPAAARVGWWDRWTRLSHLGRSRRAATAARSHAGGSSSRRISSGAYGTKASSSRRPKGIRRKLARTRRQLARRTTGRRSSRSTQSRRIPRRR